MAIIDEYKQAVQDVLDGRAPDAPHPDELPNTEDKLAAQSFAAAALAKAMEAGGDGPEVFVVQYDSDEETWNHTCSEIIAAIDAGKLAIHVNPGYPPAVINKTSTGGGHWQLNWKMLGWSAGLKYLYIFAYFWNDSSNSPIIDNYYIQMTKE